MIIKTTFNKFLVGLLSVFLLLNSCSQNSSMGVGMKNSSNNSSLGSPTVTKVESKPKLVAVLLHGMGEVTMVEKE